MVPVWLALGARLARPRCARGACLSRPRCAPGSSQVRARCVSGSPTVRARCSSGSLAVRARCVSDSFVILTLSFKGRTTNPLGFPCFQPRLSWVQGLPMRPIFPGLDQVAKGLTVTYNESTIDMVNQMRSPCRPE